MDGAIPIRRYILPILLDFNMPTAPLAERLRPQTLDHYVGQGHLAGPDGLLRRWIAQGQAPSLLLWGPPGVGKTTLARLLAQSLGRPFQSLSAVQAGVKEVRAVLEMAEVTPGMVLFLDEIHRFNKAQQDALLPAVERGLILLIGATTENPSFEVIPALLSRMQTYVLSPLTDDEVLLVVQRGLALLAQEGTQAELTETQALVGLAAGDGRKALSLLELVLQSHPTRPLQITNERVMAAAQQRTARYDKAGEQHYDIISAFIKSLRGSDPHAAVYWLARMLEGGEDVRFIARRMVILASEDVGNANPNGLLLATACFTAVEQVGLPEARIILAQTATYLATSAKSNAAYAAINEAQAEVRRTPDLPVPLHLRNAPTGLMKQLGYGKGYKYSHDYQTHDTDGQQGNQDFMPDALSRRVFYRPKDIGREKELRQAMQQRWQEWYPLDVSTDR